MKFNKSLIIGLGIVVICGAGVSYSLVKYEENEVLSKEQAQEIVLQKVPNGNIIEIEYDSDEISPKYDSKVLKDNVLYEVDVDANTGSIINFEEEIIQQDTTKNTKDKLISEQNAKNIMLKKVPNATIKTIHLDKEHKESEYEGELIKGDKKYEITINAKTGQVKEFSQEIINKKTYDNQYGELQIND